MEAGLPRLTRLGLDGYAMLVDGEDNRRELTVRRGYLTLQDRRLAPEPHLYHAFARHDDAIDLPLREGEKYEAIVNPYDLTHLIVLDARGAVLGEVLTEAAGENRAQPKAPKRKAAGHCAGVKPVDLLAGRLPAASAASAADADDAGDGVAPVSPFEF